MNLVPKRTLLSALALVLCTAGVAAGASKALGWAAFYLARPVSASPAPGLVSPAGSSSETPTKTNEVPTIRACATHWNAAAPSTTKKWIVTRAHAADVTRLQTAEQVNGGTIVVSQCAYAIAVSRTQILLAVAPLAGTNDPWRGSVMRYRSAGTVTKLRKQFNAVVRPNGSLKLGH